MADSGEIRIDLKDVEDQGFVTAKVTWKEYKGDPTNEHRIKHLRLAEPWEKWKEKGNRLEPTWQDPPQGWPWYRGEVFKVGQYTVGEGKNGKNDVKWTVWEESKKLSNLEVELYSVMRAEHYFIKKGYRKCASKYFQDGRGENYGVDSFFKNERPKGLRYILCESKFTRDETAFNQWMEEGDEERRNQLIFNKLRCNSPSPRWRKKYPYMSWEWLRDRVKRAIKCPAGQYEYLTDDLKAELKLLEKHVRKSRNRTYVHRYVNFFGAERVPIYPGRYKLVTRARNRLTKEALHLEWKNFGKVKVKKKEFIKLDDDFNKWVKEQVGK